MVHNQVIGFLMASYNDFQPVCPLFKELTALAGYPKQVHPVYFVCRKHPALRGVAAKGETCVAQRHGGELSLCF
jgi:hypothetical protein